MHHLELFGPKLGGDEAQHPHAPRSVSESLGGLGQQFPNLSGRQQGQGQERQAATVGHRGGEGGSVADPGHGTLGDRVPGAVGLGHTAARCQWRSRSGGIEMFGDRGPNGLYHPAHGHVPAGQPGGEATVLTKGHEVVAQAEPEPGRHLGGRGVLGQGGGGEVGSGVDAVTADHPGLAAVHGPEGMAGIGIERRLAHQTELDVEHHASTAARHHRGRGVRPDTTPRPHRHPEVDHLLEQDERLGRSDHTSGLTTRRNQAVHSRVDRSDTLSA